MSYRMLDICPAPADLTILEADLIHLQADAVGLYVVNLSIPSCVVGSGYVGTLVANGFGVLPIIVPGNTPPANLDLVQALRDWGVPPAPVAFDLEGGSAPPLTWVQGKVDELLAADYFPGLYGDASFQGLYGTANWRWRWLANWTYLPGIAAGYQAQQWSNQGIAPSGIRYDVSDVEDDLVMWGRQIIAPTVPPITPLPPPADPIPAEVSFPAVLVRPPTT